MNSNSLYQVIPKDNDPDVASVLDFITNCAKRHFDYSNLEQIFEPLVDPDFFLFQNLVVNGAKQDKIRLFSETFFEFMQKGYMVVQDKLQEIMTDIENNCGYEAYVMSIAADLMFHQGWSPADAHLSVMQLLSNR